MLTPAQDIIESTAATPADPRRFVLASNAADGGSFLPRLPIVLNPTPEKVTSSRQSRSSYLGNNQSIFVQCRMTGRCGRRKRRQPDWHLRVEKYAKRGNFMRSS